MQDLAPYRPVSAMPAVRRDLSVAVGPRRGRRDARGPGQGRAGRRRGQRRGRDDPVQHPGEDLPAAAAARLGARPGQRNLLVRVVLRHLERSLTDDEANSLRDRIYAAIHQGSRHQWAVPPVPRARAEARGGRVPE